MTSSRSTGPRILITRAADIAGEWEDYARCMSEVGGGPFAFDVDGFTTVEALPPHDGILIPAGVDVDPARYGQERSERVTEVDPVRDAVEEALIAHALATGTPVLCICRGLQILNTSQGGTLLQHIERREPHRARRGEDGETIESGWHSVEVVPGSLLQRVTGASSLWVNSRHHQAVLAEQIAPGLIATGVAPDGIIEALEVPDAAWALGIQWHPERLEMTENPDCYDGSVRLFAAFVEACRRKEIP
jgi:putative glutamine amidotransferase